MPGYVKKNRKSRLIFRLLLLLLIIVLTVFFGFGPGRMLIPALLPSYDRVTDNENIVYYSGENLQKATEALNMTSIARDSILRFWNDTNNTGSRTGITVFYCDSPETYYRLTWNHAMGSALLGRIVLNPDRYNAFMSLYAAMVHEMSHKYISLRHGFLSSVFLFPKWFDEGCATVLQDYSFAAEHMGDYLAGNPELVSVTSLIHPWHWQSLLRMENGNMTVKAYGQVCLFTRFLMNTYGAEKIREYESRLQANFRTEETFEEVFQVSLKKAENQWLKEQKQSGLFPADTRLVPLASDFTVVLRWILIFLVILIPVVIIISFTFSLFNK